MKNNKKGKVVVTGGCGFIGSYLVDALVKEGFTVHIIGKSKNKKALHNKAVFHNANICNLKSIRPIIKGARFVFHLASVVGEQYSVKQPTLSNRVNINGTLNVLLACQEAGVERLVYSSSSAIYGNQSKLPHREDMLPNPSAPYGIQKYTGELYCKIWSELYKLSTVSLRYFSVYGPRPDLDYPRTLVIDRFLKNKMDDKVFHILGNGKRTRDFINVRDVVRANILAAKSKKVGKGEAINIGTGKNYSINEIAKLIGGNKIKHLPSKFGPTDTLADISKAKKLLGWQPKIKLEDGIKELKKIWKI